MSLLYVEKINLMAIDFIHSCAQRMGSAEDEFGDGGARYSKLRPMRIEMHLSIHYNN